MRLSLPFFLAYKVEFEYFSDTINLLLIAVALFIAYILIYEVIITLKIWKMSREILPLN